MWSGWVQGYSDGALVPMLRLVPIEKDDCTIRFYFDFFGYTF